MPTNERLIRNLCRARLEELKERATVERAAVVKKVRVSDMPLTHRRLLQRLRHHTAEKDKAKQLLIELGYSVYDRSEYATTGELDRPSKMVEADQKRVNEKDRQVRLTLEKLQSVAIVATLGAPPAKAQPLLQQLLTDLRRL